MSDKSKLALWLILGLSVCALLIPTITDVKGMLMLINLAAFMAIFLGGIIFIVLPVWLWRKYKGKQISIFPSPILTATRTMVLVMIAFGVYWYDFTGPRAHDFGAEYRYHLQTPEDLSDGWPIARASQLGIDEQVIEYIVERFVNDESYKKAHSMLIAREGKLLVEEYFYDESPEKPHDLRSANKSITSILVGIAIDQGLIGSVDDSVANYFPEYQATFNSSASKKDITIKHLLTMSSGLDANDWNRDSPGNENKVYRLKEDWVKLFFELELINQPGSTFAYSTLGEIALRALLANVSGMSLNEFADQNLFTPLGIVDQQWTLKLYGREDVPIRVELTSRDFLKLGQLYLNKGMWHGRRIVSEDWVAQSTSTHTRTNEKRLGNPEYAYLWWRHTFEVDGKTIRGFQAQGAGGQFLFVFPELDAVLVFTSDNYGRSRQINPLKIVKHELAPVLVGAKSKKE
jgi:CubicO group peptidase (beta-lactamase class C family)